MFKLLQFLLLPLTAFAKPAVLISWPANPETNIAGYIVYYGPASCNYTTVTNVGNVTNYTFEVTYDTVYYIAVSAYNDWGLESAITNECRWRSPFLRYLTNTITGTDLENNKHIEIKFILTTDWWTNDMEFYKSELQFNRPGYYPKPRPKN